MTEAGLVETLQGEGPFTVFAPTDEVFAALPEGTVEGLLADKPALTDVLLYHVVPGKVMAADVTNLESAETIMDQPVNITTEDGMVKVGEALEGKTQADLISYIASSDNPNYNDPIVAQLNVTIVDNDQSFKNYLPLLVKQ